MILVWAFHPEALTLENEYILEIYEIELKLLAEDVCEQFKNLSENILKDKSFKKDLTPEMSGLKLFLQQFLRDYPHVKRYRNFEAFLMLITQTADLICDHKLENYSEEDMKFKIAFLIYFAKLLEDFKKNYENLIKKLKQLEELHTKNMSDNKELRKLLNQMENFENLQEFLCAFNRLDVSTLCLNITKDTLIKYALKDHMKFLNIVFIGSYNHAKLILQDDLYNELSFDFDDIPEFITLFEINNDTKQFLLAVKDDLNLPTKYLNNRNFSSKDQKILNEIFTKYTANWPPITKYENGLKDVKQKLASKLIEYLETEPDSLPQEYKDIADYKAF